MTLTPGHHAGAHALHALRNAFFSYGFRRFGFPFSRDYLRFAWRAGRRWGDTAPGVLRMLGSRVSYANQSHALFLVHEIFVNGAYAFEPVTPRPRIIDCGANVGMSVAFFKALCPAADVVAYEPDANTFARLQQTVQSSGLGGVRLVNAAVADRSGTLAFYAGTAADGSLTASLHPAWGGAARVDVRAVRLSDALDQPVDFLKMDIEGAEYAVFRDLLATGAIDRVREAVVEYHALDAEPDEPGRLVEGLRARGMRVTVAATEERVGLLRATRA